MSSLLSQMTHPFSSLNPMSLSIYYLIPSLPTQGHCYSSNAPLFFSPTITQFFHLLFMYLRIQPILTIFTVITFDLSYDSFLDHGPTCQNGLFLPLFPYNLFSTQESESFLRHISEDSLTTLFEIFNHLQCPNPYIVPCFLL